MITKTSREVIRLRKHARIRKKISGTPACPRLCVFRSNKQIYAQIIDDVNKVTLCAAGSLDKKLNLQLGSNVEDAKAVGTELAEKALAKGVKEVVFDRGGYVYHGRVAALAEAARAAGLEF